MSWSNTITSTAADLADKARRTVRKLGTSSRRRGNVRGGSNGKSAAGKLRAAFTG